MRFIVGEQKRDIFFKRIIGVFDFLFHFVALEFVPFADKFETLVVFARRAESPVRVIFHGIAAGGASERPVFRHVFEFRAASGAFIQKFFKGFRQAQAVNLSVLLLESDVVVVRKVFQDIFVYFFVRHIADIVGA